DPTAGPAGRPRLGGDGASCPPRGRPGPGPGAVGAVGTGRGERTVREVLDAHGWPARVVRPLGAGLDHAAYDVDDELVVRVRRDGGDVAREARLLEELADALPLPVPRPVLTDPGR